MALWRFANSLKLDMKKTFPPKSQLRIDLAEHRVVACFNGYRAPITNPWARKAARTAGLPVDETRHEVWLSVAFMNFNPYGPSWMRMARRLGDVEVAIPADVIPLASAGAVFSTNFAVCNFSISMSSEA